jgi:hypothetical protein
LASRAALAWPDDPGPDPVSAIVQRYLSTRDRGRNWPYTALSQLTKDLEATDPPVALVKLAQIPFRLFVSTTTDTYLQRALNVVRFDGRAETLMPPYGLGSKVDLPEGGGQPLSIVFPLLGLANPSADYAVTDEDVLEFVHQFQASGTPRRLLDTLRKSHLLLIGSGFSDWLARFLVRLAKPGRLWTSSSNQLTLFIADRSVTEDPRLLDFLQHPLSDTEVFPTTHAEHFVDELHRRWAARHPLVDSGTGLVVEPPIDDSLRQGGVFLSYCSEDYGPAQRVREALDRAGLDIWFDKRDLQAGDEFQRKIIGQIAKSYFFVAVLSRRSLTREPRFVHLEWREAEVRSKFAAFDLPYALPVAIDEASEQDERFPPFLRRVQWTRAPGGVVPGEFVQTLVNAYRQIQRPSR